MLAALSVFFGAILLGTFLNWAFPVKKPKGIDVYVNGHKVNLVSLESFRTEPVVWEKFKCLELAQFKFTTSDVITIYLDGLLIKQTWDEKTRIFRQLAREGKHR